MSSAKLGYDFTALPRRRHALWMGLAHGLGQFLYAPLFELNGGNPIPFHGNDWRVSLCRTWSLAGKARSPVCKSLDELHKRGVIAVGAGVISVLFQPDSVHPEEVSRRNSTTQRPQLDHSAATQQPLSGSQTPQLSPNAGRHLDLSAENNSESKTQIDREKERKKERENAGAHASDFRRPVGEPPPGFVETYREPDPEPPLEEQIIKLWRGAVYAKLTKWPGSTKQVAAGAAEVAAWLRENVRDGIAPLSDFQAALKLYIADDKESLRKNTWPLSWLVERLPGYLAPAAPKPEAPKSNNPTHQIWKAPDYEAEVRESYERAGEAPPPTRVVVSIVEAKPPAKRAAPLNEQQRQERIRLLQEQAEKIRAASAAE